MGKPKVTGSNSNVSKTKAGKKSGAYQEPPKPNADKRDARLLGEQQFVRDTNARLDRLPQEMVFAQVALFYGVKHRPAKDWDTGLRYDTARKRVVVPHGQLTNGY